MGTNKSDQFRRHGMGAGVSGFSAFDDPGVGIFLWWDLPVVKIFWGS